MGQYWNLRDCEHRSSEHRSSEHSSSEQEEVSTEVVSTEVFVQWYKFEAIVQWYKFVAIIRYMKMVKGDEKRGGRGRRPSYTRPEPNRDGDSYFDIV